jgi:uncharacterized membrane protein YphA (DoxX/SURF4 family)
VHVVVFVYSRIRTATRICSEVQTMNGNSIFRSIIRTEDAPWFILIRIMVGAVFLSEGIQKFVYPASYGVGRFIKIGIPAPEILGPFVGVMEIACGILILIGFLTRLAALQTLIIMTVAIISTKIPILLGGGFWGFHVRELSRYGFFAMAHEMRTDWSMWLGSLFLIWTGAGRWSLDIGLARSFASRQDQVGL